MAAEEHSIWLTIDLSLVDKLELHMEQAVKDGLLTEDEAIKILTTELVKSIRVV